MNIYFAVKTVHIISATVLFGTGLGIAFFFFYGQRQSDKVARLFAAKATVLADFVFTLPAVILQPLTGIFLIVNGGYRGDEGWLIATYILWVFRDFCG